MAGKVEKVSKYETFKAFGKMPEGKRRCFAPREYDEGENETTRVSNEINRSA